MTVVGFNFQKIEAKRNPKVSGKINIKNNANIINAEETDLSLGSSSQKGVKFIFEFISSYEPNLGSITLTGDVLYLAEDKKVADVLKEWKKDKKLPKDVTEEVINTILTKCNVEAVILSREVDLPPPMPMPKVANQA